MSMQQLGADGMRDRLEREAEVTRARLLGAINALERRRQELFDVGAQIRKHQRQISLAGGGAAGVGLLAATFLLLRARRRQRRVRQERVRAVARFWTHPERLARRPRYGLFNVMVNLAVAVVAGVGLEASRFVLARRRRAPAALVLPPPPVAPPIAARPSPRVG